MLKHPVTLTKENYLYITIGDKERCVGDAYDLAQDAKCNLLPFSWAEAKQKGFTIFAINPLVFNVYICIAEPIQN